MSAYSALEQSRLDFQLLPITIRELLYLDSTPCDVYINNDQGLYEKCLSKNTYLDNEMLRELIHDKHTTLYVKDSEKIDLINAQQENLRAVTRSLSIGDPMENGRKQLNLLTINLAYLYENPMNDQILNLQYQSVKNLFHFLFDRPNIHVKLYQDFLKYKHHYILAQPLISSLFLIGVLKSAHLFNPKEIENLFVTSYFKDIGMSAVPIEKFEQGDLNEHDKKILTKHPDLSVKILQGRVQLSPNHFKIIENHHAFSLLDDTSNTITKDNNLVITGFETVMISVMDIISAMIAERPYRHATTLFEALDMIKVLISNDYPNEFKIIVNYFRHFLAKLK